MTTPFTAGMAMSGWAARTHPIPGEILQICQTRSKVAYICTATAEVTLSISLELLGQQSNLEIWDVI